MLWSQVNMLNLLTLSIVNLTAIYFLLFALIALLKPEKASNFLLGFASSPSLHYIELLIRALVGAAFVVQAKQMLITSVFSAFGWVLIGSTAALVLIPWHWHQKFSTWAVPKALPYLKLIALVSLLIAGFIIFCTIAGIRK